MKAAEVRGRLDAEARSRCRLGAGRPLAGRDPAADLTDLGGPGAVLGDGWLARVQDDPGLRARVVSIDGAGSALASVVARNYVRDLERLSGGTGTEVIEVSDPEIRRAGEGLVLDVLPSLVPETPWAQVRVGGELARPPRFERAARSRSASTLEMTPGAKPGMSSAPRATGSRWTSPTRTPTAGSTR